MEINGNESNERHTSMRKFCKSQELRQIFISLRKYTAKS